MISEEEYLKALEIVKAYQKQINEQVRSVEGNVLPKNIEDLQISTRARNAIFSCLPNGSRNFGIGTPIRDALQFISIGSLQKGRNVGQKTLLEIKSEFAKYGVEI